jgi:hypothetical protein
MMVGWTWFFLTDRPQMFFMAAHKLGNFARLTETHMHRANAYATPAADGGVNIDVEGMMVDLIAIVKTGGITRDMLLDKIREMWNEVQVEVTIPNEAKN